MWNFWPKKGLKTVFLTSPHFPNTYVENLPLLFKMLIKGSSLYLFTLRLRLLLPKLLPSTLKSWNYVVSHFWCQIMLLDAWKNSWSQFLYILYNLLILRLWLVAQRLSPAVLHHPIRCIVPDKRREKVHHTWYKECNYHTCVHTCCVHTKRHPWLLLMCQVQTDLLLLQYSDWATQIVNSQ